MQQSPYIDRLKQAIADARDPSTRAMLRAELAGSIARLGDFSEAEAEIADLRREFGDGRSGRVSIMIMCAEAQLIYYKDLGEQARDRMMRAQVLSVAGRDAALTALTSAWLAHIAFNLHRHEEMARSAKTCLDTVSRTDHEATARLALTLGDAFYAADQMEVGNRWYAKAHEHANKLGDHATIAALTYNRAAMGTFMARLQAAVAQVDATRAARLSSEVRTAVNYQAIAQLTSLQALLDYALASSHILAGRYTDALAPLEKLVETMPSTSPLERSLVIRCDLALCLGMTGRMDEARACIAAVPVEALAKCTPDDQVVAAAALAAAARACGLSAEAAQAEASLVSAIKEHEEGMASLRKTLAPFNPEAVFSRI